jgi:branched-chain amino acid transport system ATP-binding protein
MLRVASTLTYYGPVQALKGVSLHVTPGEIVTLVGANGAGKTTLLNTICGVTPAARGSVHFGEQEITRWPTQRIVRAGISQVPEGRQLFGEMTVADNLLLGAYQRSRGEKRALQAEFEAVFEVFPVLEERRRQRAGTLSGGEQQMLAIARALMAAPKLLLLDEPSVGLAPRVAREIFRVIAGLRNRGTTILLVEQNARAALQVADRGYVIETGAIVLEGTAQELLDDKEVQRAYLGKGYGQQPWE